MKTAMGIVGTGLLIALIFPVHAWSFQAQATGSPPSPEKPGTIERAALAKLDYMIGDWTGEGWAQTGPGQRAKFWVKEYYRYRGDKDLMDMEGRFGGILPDGTMLPEQEYSLGILSYDRKSNEYRMWHYSNDGMVFTVKIDVDIEGRSGQYTMENAKGEKSRFRIAIGKDGVWISQREILTPDNTWLKVMEFRMKRR